MAFPPHLAALANLPLVKITGYGYQETPTGGQVCTIDYRPLVHSLILRLRSHNEQLLIMFEQVDHCQSDWLDQTLSLTFDNTREKVLEICPWIEGSPAPSGISWFDGLTEHRIGLLAVRTAFGCCYELGSRQSFDLFSLVRSQELYLAYRSFLNHEFFDDGEVVFSGEVVELLTIVHKNGSYQLEIREDYFSIVDSVIKNSIVYLTIRPRNFERSARHSIVTIPIDSMIQFVVEKN